MDDLEELEAKFRVSLEKFKKENGKNAFDKCEELAQYGEPEMQLFLGAMYEQGDGALRHYVYAYQWYNIAASNGEVLGGKFRDEIEKKMIPEDISAGQNGSSMLFLTQRRMARARLKSLQEQSKTPLELDKTIEKFADVLALLKDHSTTDRIAVQVTSAQKGDATAQFALGKIYTNGAVVRANKSYIIAYMFFTFAAQNGHESGYSALSEISEKMLKTHVALADKFVQEWIKKYVETIFTDF